MVSMKVCLVRGPRSRLTSGRPRGLERRERGRGPGRAEGAPENVGQGDARRSDDRVAHLRRRRCLNGRRARRDPRRRRVDGRCDAADGAKTKALIIVDGFSPYHGEYLSHIGRRVHGAAVIHVLSDFMTRYLHQVQGSTDHLASRLPNLDFDSIEDVGGPSFGEAREGPRSGRRGPTRERELGSRADRAARSLERRSDEVPRRRWLQRSPGKGGQRHEASTRTSRRSVAQDVLFGRGNVITRHLGNKRFRTMVESRKREFTSTKIKRIKRAIAADIIGDIQRRGGRFLVEDRRYRSGEDEAAAAAGGDSSNVHPMLVDKAWTYATPDQTREKVLQRLREKEVDRGGGGDSDLAAEGRDSRTQSSPGAAPPPDLRTDASSAASSILGRGLGVQLPAQLSILGQGLGAQLPAQLSILGQGLGAQLPAELSIRLSTSAASLPGQPFNQFNFPAAAAVAASQSGAPLLHADRPAQPQQ
ncbi:hypothetical protein ACHAWF_018326 [Thalassiosira exigua]